MSCTLPRSFKAQDYKLRIVEGNACTVQNTMLLPQRLRLATPQQGSGTTILLAYGSEPVRRALAAIMIQQGYAVVCCGDGDAALR